MTWQAGRDKITDLISDGELERVMQASGLSGPGSTSGGGRPSLIGYKIVIHERKNAEVIIVCYVKLI